MTTIAERVAKGAALLDEKNPGWDEQINLPDLDILGCRECVLGQLFGDFSAGIQQLRDSLPDYDSDIQHGFYWNHADEIPDLTDQWCRTIDARRAAA